MRGEGFHAEGLGGVMAAVKDVEPKFFGEGVGPVWTFAGDEGVHAGGSSDLQISAGAPVTMPMRRHIFGPPGISLGFAPVARARRVASSSREIWAMVWRPMG